MKKPDYLNTEDFEAVLKVADWATDIADAFDDRRLNQAEALAALAFAVNAVLIGKCSKPDDGALFFKMLERFSNGRIKVDAICNLPVVDGSKGN